MRLFRPGTGERLPVPRIERRDWEEEDEADTALNAAIRLGHFEIVKKMGVDASRDDVTQLLNQYLIQPNPELIDLLIKKGADVANLRPEVIESVVSAFEWGLDSSMGSSRIEAVTE